MVHYQAMETDNDDFVTGSILLDFLTKEGRAGRMNAGTASSRRSAVRTVLRAKFGEDDWETTPFEPQDAPDLADHFAEVSADDFVPGSIASYRSDFVRTVSLWVHRAKKDASEDDDYLKHTIAMRPGVTAQLIVPVDLTAREAKRLAALIVALPIDDGE